MNVKWNGFSIPILYFNIPNMLLVYSDSLAIFASACMLNVILFDFRFEFQSKKYWWYSISKLMNVSCVLKQYLKILIYIIIDLHVGFPHFIWN